MSKAILCIFLGSVLVGEVSHVFPNRKKALTAAKEFFKTVEKTESLQEISSCHQDLPKKIHGNLKFQNVSFKYPSRKNTSVLNNFSTEISAGKTLALVGRSGSGKSTVLSLVERLYEEWEGKILLDDIDIRDISLSALRSQIGYVQQEPEIFNRSIRENILYGLSSERRKAISEDDLLNASRAANAHEFIIDLPGGYDSIAGPRGERLSGGQRQRIAIARCIIRNPPVLLLDEATSALDLESEQLVQDALISAVRGRTTIVVAHRLSTIQNCNSIAVVHDGKVVEQGTHDELLALQKSYSNLYYSKV